MSKTQPNFVRQRRSAPSACSAPLMLAAAAEKQLAVSGQIATVDGTQPPALKEFILETDRNGAVDLKGYPTCKASRLHSRPTARRSSPTAPAPKPK